MSLPHFDSKIVLTGALRQELRSLLCSLGVADKLIETHESAKHAEHSVERDTPTLLILSLDATTTEELEFLENFGFKLALHIRPNVSLAPQIPINTRPIQNVEILELTPNPTPGLFVINIHFKKI